MASLIVILVVAPLFIRWHSRRAENGDGDVADRVHRIRRAQMAVSLTLLILAVLALVEALAEARLLGLSVSHAVRGIGVVLVLVGYAAGALLCYLAAYPATARLRGLPSQPGQAGGRQLRMLTVVLGPQLAYWALIAVIRAQHGWAQYLLLPLVIIYVVAMVVYLPRLMRALVAKHPVDEQTRRRLERMAAEQHVRLRGILRMDTGPESTANAMLTGLLPRQRYVFITDRLLSDFEPDELDAVFAHELAHATRHHLPIKLGVNVAALLLPYAVAAGILAALPGHPSGSVSGLVLGLAFVLSVAALLLVQGVVGIRLERAADDLAAATVSPDALRRGLEKLAAANAAKRRTGRLWNVLTQHPGLDQRIERLRGAAPASAQPAEDGSRVA